MYSNVLTAGIFKENIQFEGFGKINPVPRAIMYSKGNWLKLHFMEIAN